MPRQLPLLLILLFLFGSCAVQKRRYSKGWYVEHKAHPAGSVSQFKKSNERQINFQTAAKQSVPENNQGESLNMQQAPVSLIPVKGTVSHALPATFLNRMCAKVRTVVVSRKKEEKSPTPPEKKIPAPGSSSSLVLGVLAVLTPIVLQILFAAGILPNVIFVFAFAYLLALASMVAGSIALKELRRFPEKLKGRSAAVAGLSLAWLVFAYMTVILLFVLFL